MRGATISILSMSSNGIISIHAPHAGRDSPPKNWGQGKGISIHAPHAGRDKFSNTFPPVPTDFNPRAPCGARLDSARHTCRPYYFNPRAPCGARPVDSAFIRWMAIFQSTRPMRGATTTLLSGGGSTSYFNPRAPCGARLFAKPMMALSLEFQSTRPMRGATPIYLIVAGCHAISIHAPHAGRDAIYAKAVKRRHLFQSTRPMRGATDTADTAAIRQRHFNPRAPCGARQLGPRRKGRRSGISIHAPHAGRDAGPQPHHR